MTSVYLAIACGLIGVLYAAVLGAQMRRLPDRDATTPEETQSGLSRHYTTTVVVAAVAGIILFLVIGGTAAVGLLIGVILSGVASHVGATMAVRAGLTARSEAIAGVLGSGLGLIAIAGMFWYLVGGAGVAPSDRAMIEALVGLASGWSLTAIFARVGGEPGAANDLSETYVVAIAMTMASVALVVKASSAELIALMSLPLLAAGVCILTGIVGTTVARITGRPGKGFLVSISLSVFAIYGVCRFVLKDLSAVIGAAGFLDGAGDALAVDGALGPVAEVGQRFTGLDLFWCMMIGLAVAGLLVSIADHHSRSVRRPLPTLVIVVAVIAAHHCAGIIGVAFAATPLVALAGTVGASTKLSTQAYAMGAATLAALVLFGVYTTDLKELFPDLIVDLGVGNPYVIVGLLLGAMLAYPFGVPASVRRVIVRATVPVVSPVAVYAVVTAVAGQSQGFAALGAFLLGIIVSRSLLATAMSDDGDACRTAAPASMMTPIVALLLLVALAESTG